MYNFDSDKDRRLHHRIRCHHLVDKLPDRSVEEAEEVLSEICRHYSAIENSINETLPLPFKSEAGDSV